MIDCPHCNPKSYALLFPLFGGEQLTIYTDGHPLTEGHILIITNEHTPCMGSLKAEFKEFKKLYGMVISFLSKEYGPFAVFEHGITGQTVYHTHMHFLPFRGSLKDIVKEKGSVSRLKSVDEIKALFRKEGKYLFLQINKDLFSVDTGIGTPRFFRDRFAKALGRPERGNWKEMYENKELMKKAAQEIMNVKMKWRKYHLNPIA
jgi:diadenosine tetraphosphate (Ap4A) HIT family hydrolase